MPLNPRVLDLMPFSATLQWDPPSDNGGSSLPLTYTVTLTNTSTSLPLPNLQHSTQYSWSVQAINEYGSSPPAEGTFTTNDTGKHDQVSPYYVCYSTCKYIYVCLCMFIILFKVCRFV